MVDVKIMFISTVDIFKMMTDMKNIITFIE